jgi:hypothetical protein
MLILLLTAVSHRPKLWLVFWALYLAAFASKLPRTLKVRPSSSSNNSLDACTQRSSSMASRFVGSVSAFQPPLSSFRTQSQRISSSESVHQNGCERFTLSHERCRRRSSRYGGGIVESSSVSRDNARYASRTCLFLSQSNTHNDDEGDEEEEEWHPRDPAHTTPQLLAGIWHQISEASGMPKGDTYSVLYPHMQHDLNTPRFLQSLFHHLDVCKDVCDHFGISTTLVPLQDAKTKQVIGFTAKSFRNPKDASQEDGDDMEFPYDPMWDDGTDYDTLYAGIDDEYDDGPAGSKSAASSSSSSATPIENEVPSEDETITEITQQWVGKLMSDMGICPFTSGPNRAGLPLGDVLYTLDRSTTVEDMYARFWKEVIRIEQVKEKDLSTTLLIVPHFFLHNVEMFENFSNTLTQSLTSLQIEDLIQLVFFHPHWSFRDGMDRSGAGSAAAANYARRSPWPMINLLRTNQVRSAQRGIPTGAVYQQNAKALAAVGVDKLEGMLRQRNWSDIEEYKVNRRELDALRIAQDYQATGSVRPKDLTLEGDRTPAANKVDRRQVEQGDLVTVLLQAMDKRLGRGSSSGAQGHHPQALSGPETSASAMAADFLIQQLDAIVSSSRTAAVSAASSFEAPPAAAALDPREAARLARMEAARQALLADVAGDRYDDADASADRGDEMSNVLFGKGGIPDRADDDQFNKGLDPSSFY